MLMNDPLLVIEYYRRGSLSFLITKNYQARGIAMFDIFLAHSKEQKQLIAIPLTEELRELGFSVWLDRWYIHMGYPIFSTIEKAITESALGIVVISPEFLHKAWTMHELDCLCNKSEKNDESSVLLILYQSDIEDVAKYHSHLLYAAYEHANIVEHQCANMSIIIARIIASYYSHILGMKNSENLEEFIEQINTHKVFSNNHKTILIELIQMYIHCYGDIRLKVTSLCNIIGYIKGMYRFYIGANNHAIDIGFNYTQLVLHKKIFAIEPIDYEIYIAIETAVHAALMLLCNSGELRNNAENDTN